jgi:hypothetical protein
MNGRCESELGFEGGQCVLDCGGFNPQECPDGMVKFEEFFDCFCVWPTP